jgi:hypothetical protein
MKNDTTQKPGYETYWGQMTNFLKMNDFEYNSIKEEWEHLNLFEQKDAQEHYKKILIENKIIETNNGKEYLKIKSNYISSKINSLITDETDCIVELGSGWGRNVISNSFINPNWKIYGGELTEEGQNSLSHFIKKYNLSNVNSFNFNWCDVSNFYNLFKNKNYKEIIIYSVHSIEQVSYLDIEQFKKILSLPFKIKFFHVEPCSWQWAPPRKISGWNENFKEVLDTLEKQNLIKNLNADVNGCKLNLIGSGAEGVSITYKKS